MSHAGYLLPIENPRVCVSLFLAKKGSHCFKNVLLLLSLQCVQKIGSKDVNFFFTFVNLFNFYSKLKFRQLGQLS